MLPLIAPALFQLPFRTDQEVSLAVRLSDRFTNPSHIAENGGVYNTNRFVVLTVDNGPGDIRPALELQKHDSGAFC
jgi:hypothetical protein